MSDTFELVASPPYPSERRQHSRQQVRSIAYVELDEGNGGIVLNVSEGGLSVQAVVSLMDEQLPRMRIQLPQPQDWVETGARIAWTGKSRKVVGLEFVDLPEQARSQIREWVSRETLPAPPPPELELPTGETEQHEVAPVGHDGAPLPAPATAPAEDDRAVNLSLREDAPPISPVEQADEPTPVAAPSAPPTPSATPSQAPPAAPVPVLDRASRQAQPLAERGIGRALDHSHFAELRLTGRPPKVAARAPKQVSRHGVLAGLVAVLALLSLAAGWAAGRGAFDGVFARVHAVTSSRNGANGDSNSSAAGPTSAVAGTPATDTNNLRSVAPLSVPRPDPGQSPRRKETSNQAPRQPRTWAPLTAGNLPPAIHRQQARHASGMGEDDPPRVSDAPSGSILPEAGPTDFPASIPRPPTEPQTRILKPAELVHRVDPTYPTIAREQRVQGTVKLRVTIAQDGTVLGVELLSGSPLLTRAAIEAVRQWRYRPTLINGKPVQTNSEISLLFRLP